MKEKENIFHKMVFPPAPQGLLEHHTAVSWSPYMQQEGFVPLCSTPECRWASVTHSNSKNCRIHATIEMKQHLYRFLPHGCCKPLFYPKMLHPALVSVICCT